MVNTSRTRRLLREAATYVGITVATLVAADLLCNLFGLFAPTYEYGDPDVGWISYPATGKLHEVRCTENWAGKTFPYPVNEDGIRTGLHARQILTDGESLRIAVTGDSQTDLCAPNSLTHPGVLESTLRSRGVKTVVLPYAAGKYSPLQEYLGFKKFLKRYAPNALLMNLYTGNDFLDLLRVDDRPHFVPADGGYRIAPPLWYLYDDPQVKRRSRVLFALRSLAKKTGLHGQFLRVRLLMEVAAEYGESFSTVVTYMNDLRKSSEPSVGYSAAFTAQMLNQQIFFLRFPGSREESIRRVEALMEMIRQENPGTLLIMSPLPSYELAQQRPVDPPLLRTLDRLPVTYDAGVREEQELYETLRRLAVVHGWLFVDNLAPLREYRGPERLYNGFDYHLRPAASTIIGTSEAEAVLGYLRSHSAGTGPGPDRSTTGMKPR
ncbi:MAG: hypothetical protein DMH00_12995 [Acidobacteria bacterium]|nr:MAG: hypothetical protein DMH00_12995 [Acidobacteriota bacterium]